MKTKEARGGLQAVAVSPTRCAELRYLADMIPELRSMALCLEEKTLAYLLEMAAMEARLQLQLEEEPRPCRAAMHPRK
ncbi:MAG: hypothetical protein AAFN43_10890 [Pseudomonadota bacterium]